eukprot:1701132-Rhodomonas_salina.1
MSACGWTKFTEGRKLRYPGTNSRCACPEVGNPQYHCQYPVPGYLGYVAHARLRAMPRARITTRDSVPGYERSLHGELKTIMAQCRAKRTRGRVLPLIWHQGGHEDGTRG